MELAFGKFRRNFGTRLRLYSIILQPGIAKLSRLPIRRSSQYEACRHDPSAILAALSPSVLGLSPVLAADKKYGPGVTDTEIKIGQTVPYSGPISSLSRFGRSGNGLSEENQCGRWHQRP